MTPPPYPAVRMRGMQQESYVAPRQVGNIHLRLDGTKGVNKRDLLAQAVFLCMSRVYASNAATGKTGGLLMGWTVSEGLGDDECWVDVSLNWRIRPDAARIKGDPKNATSEPLRSVLSSTLNGGPGFLPGQSFGFDDAGRSTAAISTGVPWLGSPLPNVDPNRSIAPPANGLANAVRLIAAILNDPCGQTNELIAGGGFDAELRTDGPRFGAGVLNGDAPIRVANSGSSTYTAQVVPASAIPADDQLSLYAADTNEQSGIYDEYSIQSTYRYVPGSVVLPSTKAGEPARRVQLHNPRLLLTVEWRASKLGAPPILPAQKDSSDGLALYLGGSMSAKEPDLSGDGVTLRYESSGIFEFEFARADVASVSAPLPPYLSCEIAADATRAFQFSSDCIVFPGSATTATTATNPFTGQGITEVQCCGNTRVMVGGPTVNP